MPSTDTALPARIHLTERLVRRHQRGLWRYLRFLGCDANAAEDIAQDTFLRILRTPPEDRGERALARWLRTTALHLFRNAGRSPRAGVVLDVDLLEEVWTGQAGDDGGDRYVEALRPCLDRLSEPQRIAVRMRHQEGRTRAAVAAALGLTEEGAKSVLRRARARLQACIERSMREHS